MRLGPFTVTRDAGPAAPIAETVPTPPEPPHRDERCPECGGRYVTGGGEVLTVQSNGVRAKHTPSGVVLCCLKCGTRLYSTPDGLLRPHPDALPPAWAMSDLHSRMQKAQDAARKAHEEKQQEAARQPAARGPVARRPPRVEQD